MFDIAGLVRSLFSRNESQQGVHNFQSATRLLQELPESDTLMAQVEIVKALQDLNKNPKVSTKERFRTIPYLDEKAHQLQQRLINIFQGKVKDSGAPRAQVLLTITAFWSEMGHAYQLCLKQAMQSSSQGKGYPIALFTLCSMRCYLEHAKWSYLRYMELEGRTWRYINRLYLFAEQQGFAEQQLAAYPDAPPSDIRREYLKILMLSLANPEKRQPGQSELIAQWLEHWIDRLSLESIIRPHRHQFCTNLAGSSAPRRLRRDMVGENWRYWFTDPLIQHMRDTHAQLSNGADPAALGLPPESAQPANLDLLQSLSTLWSRDAAPPARKHDRRPTQKSIRVIRGLDSVIKYMQKHPLKTAAPPPAPMPIPAVSRENPDQLEFQTTQWDLENESLCGMGVRFNFTSDLKLRAGEVVGVQTDHRDHPLTVGIVRRISNRKDGKVSAGIETLTTSPILVDLAGAEKSSVRAIFSPDNPEHNQSRFLLLPQKSFNENGEYTLAAQNKAYRIRMAAAREHANNATLANFTVLAKLPN